MAVAGDGRRELAVETLANAALCWPLAMNVNLAGFDLLDAPPEHDELGMQWAVDRLTDAELDAVLGGTRDVAFRLEREAQRRRGDFEPSVPNMAQYVDPPRPIRRSPMSGESDSSQGLGLGLLLAFVIVVCVAAVLWGAGVFG